MTEIEKECRWMWIHAAFAFYLAGGDVPNWYAR